MRILKYLIFLSILCVIFSVIYRQSDKKGFRRWRTSFKTAIIFSAIAAGLIPVNPEAIEPAGNNNQVYQERLISDEEVNSFEDNDQKVILVKTGDSGPSGPSLPGRGRGQPSQFPTPPSGGRPTRPSTLVNPYGIYRPTPKVVDQGLGAGANPAGAGGGGGTAEFDDQCPAPKKQQQSQKSDRNEFQSDRYNSKKKKKKKTEDQCELDENVKDAKIEIVYRIKENPALVREAERAGRDQDAQRSLNNLVEQLSLGNRNPGIGTENVFKDVYELRGKNRARVYYREVDGKIEILGKSVKNNQQKVINILKKMYN
jgi:hypothetical protein